MINRKNLGLMFVGVLVVLIGAGSAWADLTDGLISHWTLDGHANDSAGGNHGTIYGATPTAGQVAGALDFDGVDDYINLGNDSSLKPNLPVTLSAWIKLDTLGSYQNIVRLDDSWSKYYGIFFLVSILPYQDGLALSIGGGTGKGIAHRRTKYGTTSLKANTWYHVVGVVRGVTDMDIYINGVDDGGIYGGTGGSLAYTSTGSSYIGSLSGQGVFLNGLIDEVMVYDRALSAQEVQSLYEAGLADLVSLEIIGPDEVAENSSGQYRVTAHYDNDSTRDVTSSTVWSVEPGTIAGIDENGLLTTGDVKIHQEVTIRAQYSEGGVDTEDDKVVLVQAICPSGSALKFDGVDDYVDIPDDESLQLSQSLTIEAWVKPIYDGGDYYADAILVKGENVGWGPHFNYRIAMENANLYTWGVCRSGQELFFHGGTPEFDSWQHLAVTADGSVCKAYVNGVEVGSRNAPGPYLTFPGYPLQIGGHSLTNARWFSGLIDEIRVWNIALTNDQIKANMHGELEVPQSGLVGYWNFDEGEGQVAEDLSGNGNHGTLGSSSVADGHDPIWVPSGAPIEVCTLTDIALINIEEIRERKVRLLGEIDELLEQEQFVSEVLNMMISDGDYEGLDHGDIVIAKQKLHAAGQHEKQAVKSLDKSIDKLDDSLAALNGEARSNRQGINDGVAEVKLADIDGDGMINSIDFYILSQHWLESYQQGN